MTMTTEPVDIEFKVPDSSEPFEQPCGPGTYIAKLNRIEKAKDGDFGPQIYWFWELYNTYDNANDVRAVAFEKDGTTPWCFREPTSTKFGENPKSGVKAKARIRAEALLKKEFGEGESMRASELVGKPAILHLIWKTSQDQTKQYLNVAHIEPYRKGYLAPFQAPEDAATDSADNGESIPF